MRTMSWTHKRLWLAGVAGGLAISVGLRAGDETPPPYPSMSPVLPARLPTIPSVASEAIKPEVKPVAGQIPAPPILPSVTVPKLETPTLIVPKLESPTATVPKIESPVSTVSVPSITTVPVLKSVVLIPLAPPVLPAVETKPLISSTPLVTPIQSTTESTKPEIKTPISSTIHISIGNTPGVLDNAGKFDAMLVNAKTSYGKVHDYSCHYIKQERVKGKLTPEVIYELHVRTTPFAAYTKAVQPKDAAGLESVFAAGKFATNQVRVKPNGGAFMTVPVDDSRAMSGRHTADQVGIGSLLTTLEKMLATERKLNNPMTVGINDFTYAGKTVARYEVVCDKPHAHRYSHRTVIYVDKETKLPIRFEAYDEPRGGIAGGDLLESYSFVNLKLNVGHSAAVFDR